MGTAGRFVPMAVVVAAGVACAPERLPGGGVMVVFRNDGTIPGPDTLTVQVGPEDGGLAYGPSGRFTIDPGLIAAPGHYVFPVTMGIDSNGDPAASVSLVASLSVDGSTAAAVTERFIIHSIPVDRVAEVAVQFGARCATAGGCCPVACPSMSGACVCDAAGLPPFVSPGLGSVAVPTPLADAGDVAQEGDGPDGDSGPLCEAGALQCSADLSSVNVCGSAGEWQVQDACLSGTYCFLDRCVAAPPSCAGTDYSECPSFEVPGGTFLRGNDSLHEDAGALATVSDFRLDGYEVTVQRFRAFVNTIIEDPAHALPYNGAGKHIELAGGAGLNGGGDGGTTEPGWNAAWNRMYFPADSASWSANLSCSGSGASTWQAVSGTNDARPINCVTWYEAYAFCIWDGGFLPTEAEWNYAAAGGAEQRLFPWGSASPTDGAYAIYDCDYPEPTRCNETTTDNIAGFGYPLGRSLFGQWNLAGNVAEWTLDAYEADYPRPCDDCTSLAASGQRVFRGGSYDRDITQLYTSSRVPADPAGRFQDVGIRCARSP